MPGALSVISSMATRHALEQMCRSYEKAHGMTVELTAMGGVDAARLVAAGGRADVVALAAPALNRLEAQSHVDAPICALARSRMAVAIRAGEVLPAIDTEDQLRAAMLASRVGYSTGPSGEHLQALWARWGVAAAISARAVQAPPGVPVARLVADGQADLGVQQLSELIGQPGIVIAGPLPASCDAVTVFSAAVAAVSQHKAQAQALLAYLASAARADVLRRHGLEPPEQGGAG